jgi:hypothetical protein
MIDDPILDLDDIIEIEGRKYYIIEVERRFSRHEGPTGTMRITSWRIS